MMAPENDKDIKAAARKWLLRLSLEPLTDDERAEFAVWCAKDPQHVAAYRRFESIWHDVATLQELKPLAVLERPARWWWRAGVVLRTRSGVWAAGTGLVGMIVWMGLWLLMGPTHYATGVAEVREVQL